MLSNNIIVRIFVAKHIRVQLFLILVCVGCVRGVSHVIINVNNTFFKSKRAILKYRTAPRLKYIIKLAVPGVRFMNSRIYSYTQS